MSTEVSLDACALFCETCSSPFDVPRDLQKKSMFLFLQIIRNVLWTAPKLVHPIHSLIESNLLVRLCIPVHEDKGHVQSDGWRLEAPLEPPVV